MKKTLIFLFAFISFLQASATVTTNPQPVVDLVNRVCGSGAVGNFTFTLDDAWNNYDPATGAGEAFQLGGSANAVTVKANTLSALTRGLNWYLNHEAHVNICWNNLTETPSSYPAPTDTQVHTSDVKWRYYLNYCTFSYTMSVWDEDRWMKEIDWMALHGVNLPLQIVGIDAVWYQMLRNEFGYNHDQATEFVAGPFYQSWWLMNNLQGESGPNPQWWYNRQAALGRKITDRMRELGMTPCLPGFVGMAPEKFVTDRGIDSYSGKWSNYTCPKVINAATETGAAAFRELGEKYYDYIRNVYGFMPKSFSLDPFHERSNPAGVDGYRKICDLARDVMNAASPNAMWVAQEWQNNAEQSRIDALPTENTLLLDLSSERQTFYSRFGNHEYAFCMLHNYGGNVGLYGCIDQLMNNYFDTHRNHATLKGIGANPEGLETNPVMYELLFEMPWLGSKPVAKTWLATYATNRYNLKNNTDKQYASQAWENLLSTVYNQNSSTQQGCAEPLVCIRPTKFFVQGKTDVSSWAQAQRNWDKDVMVAAAKKLLKANAINKNYLYDLVDVVRQALADKAHTLLTELKELKDAGQSSSTTFTDKRDDLMCIIDDTDLLLSYIPNFTMQRWVTMARNIAKQNGGSAAEEDWMERYARQLVTTWRPDDSSLMDYANREWAGLVKDYYKARWSYFFSSGAAVTEEDLFNNVEQKYVLGTLDGTAYGKYTQTGTANETYAADEIKALATKLLQDHTGDLGSDDDETPVQFSGDGKTHVIQPSEIGWKSNAIQATDKWEIDIAATDTGEYNWTGGVLLASGENPFAANTQGGFRLRQNASETTGSDGRFCYTNGSDNQFRRTNGRNFIIKMMYDGSQTIVTATIDGETETRTFTNTYGEISAFSYALPVGFNINSLTITPVHDTFPMNGKYCRIRSVKSRNVGKVWQAEPTATTATAAAEPHLSADTNIRLADNTYDPNSIWAFEAKGAGFLLRHANSQALANNLTHAAKETKVALDASEKNAGLFSFHDQERQDEGKWVYMLRYDTDEGYFSGRYVNKGSFGDNMTWWNGDQSTGANDFVFDEVTSVPVTFPADRYTTLCLPFAVSIPSGVRAYYVKASDTQDFEYQELKDGKIPAFEGVILEAKAAATYDFPVLYEDVPAIDGNLLVGITCKTPAMPAGSILTLSRTDKGTGLYVTDSATEMGYNTAYLPKLSGYSGTGKAMPGHDYIIPEGITSGIAEAKKYFQYVKSFSYLGNKFYGDINASSAELNKLYHLVNMEATALEVETGTDLVISWVNPSDMHKAIFLSTFCDINQDGDFEGDADFASGERGLYKQIAFGHLFGTVVIPIPTDAPTGYTRVRMRFDSAWNEAYDAGKGYMPANASSNRHIYDIIIRVVNSYDPSGIETPTQTTAQNNKVYSIYGALLGDSLDGLPAGIYIVNGKKVVKR